MKRDDRVQARTKRKKKKRMTMRRKRKTDGKRTSFSRLPRNEAKDGPTAEKRMTKSPKEDGTRKHCWFFQSGRRG